MRMISFGPVPIDPRAVRTALDEALDALGTPAKLVVLYTPIDLHYPALLGPIVERTRAPLVGATTGGVAFTERGATSEGLVGALLGGDLDVQVGLARGICAGLKEKVRAVMADMQPKYPMVSSLVLADAFACDGEALVAALGENRPLYWRYFGGFAGDCQTYRGTRVLFGEAAYDDALVVATISSPFQGRIRARHGFEIAPGARALRVTSAAGNAVRAIEGRPAADVYREELDRLGVRLQDGQNLLSQMVCHSLGMSTPFGEGLNVRAPLKLGADGSMSLGGSIVADRVVHVVKATPDRVIEAAARLTADTLDGSGAKPRAHFVVDCGIRRLILGNRYAEQIAAFEGPVPHPMLGFASYGEIARHGGTMQGFHNATAVSAVW